MNYIAKERKSKKFCVTTFYTESYIPLAAITIPVMEQWCKKHGYHFNEHIIPNNQNPHFVKTKDSRELLEIYDIVMAIECDILITNLNYKIEDWLDEENSMYITTDVNNANTAVIITKSTDLGKGLLDMVNKYENIFGDEQMVFENKRIKGVKYCEQPCFNSVPYESYYRPSYGKIGYKEGEIITPPTEQQGQWQKGHFLMHLPGMELQKRIEIFNNHLKGIIYE